MYTPPQQDSFGFDSPIEAPAEHHTYLYTPQGLGKKEKRENWIWKTYEPRIHKIETQHHHHHAPHHPHHEQPKPFSYEYVMQDGHLATMKEIHPQSPVDQMFQPHHVHSRSEELPKRRPSTKLSKSAPIVERHSSPAAPRTCKGEKENTHPEQESKESKTSKLKRALSLSSSKARHILAEHEKDRKKPLPALPKPLTLATSPLVHSFDGTGRSLPTADQFSREGYSGHLAAAPPPTPERSPRLSSTFLPPSSLPFPRHVRRPSLTIPQNASPRLPSPRASVFPVSAPHTPPSPPRSFKEPRKSPLPPARKSPQQQQQQQQSHPPTPPSTPPPSTPSLSTPPADQGTHQSEAAGRPQLKRRPSKFIEMLDSPSIEIRKQTDSPPIPSPPVPVIQQPPVPKIRTTPASASPQSPHRRFMSADEAKTKDYFFKNESEKPKNIKKPDMIELRHSPGRAFKTLQAATISSQQATLVPARQATVASRPAVQIVDNKAPKSAGLPRSMSLRVPGERRPRDTWPEMPRICTAELRPVLASPVIAIGTAKLVKC